MVLRQLLLPKEGGGSLRRFLALRKRLFLDQWNDSRPLRGPVPLLDIRRPDDSADLRESLNPTSRSWPFKGWRGSDDSVIGGFSTSKMEYVEGSGDGDGDAASLSSSSPPFLRWSGTLSTQINAQSSKSHSVTRSGFAAILSPEFPGSVPLGSKYKALEICCRPDDRTYAVNLHVETYFPEDVYQGFIVGGGGGSGDGGSSNSSTGGGNYFNGDSRRQYDYNDPRSLSYDMNDPHSINDAFAALGKDDVRGQDPTLDVRQYLKQRRELIRQTPMISSDDHPYHGHPPRGFQRYILPFRDFVLTSRGRMRQAQRGLDGAVCIESIGFTLMDGKDGDFTFDLVSLRAVNVMNGEVVGTLDDERMEEEFQDGLRPKLKIKKDEDEEQLSEEESMGSSESGRINEKRL